MEPADCTDQSYLKQKQTPNLQFTKRYMRDFENNTETNGLHNFPGTGFAVLAPHAPKWIVIDVALNRLTKFWVAISTKAVGSQVTLDPINRYHFQVTRMHL